MKKRIKYKIVITMMVVLISVLHYFVGLPDSPVHGFYRLLYYIPIILAAFVFGFRGGVTVSLLVGIIYSPFLLLSFGGFGWEAINDLLDIVLFFAIGIITGILVEKENMSLKRLDDELKRYILLENYTSGIIESIKSGVVAVNNDLLITMINKGAKNILKVGDNCIGQNFSDAFSCCKEVNERIYDSVRKGIAYDNLELIMKDDNTVRTIKISLYPLIFEETKKGLVIILEDVTEVKRLQQHVQRNDKLAALGELSSGIAHEIRNPLGIIKAIGQTMKNELSTNLEVVNELEIIDEEIERANRIVKALMEFGRPGGNKKMSLSISSILKEVFTVTSKYMEQHKVELIFEEVCSADVIGDKEQLKQAFINIIFNAVQAMNGGGKLSVCIKEDLDKAVGISFKDTGTGITDGDISKIFNPFFTTKDDGTGLGLSIVHRIVEEHGGKINVISKRGQGTTFEIVLPQLKEVS
ncbi:MAG: ATP-binding protein [Clostridia bacterium]|nr:ATP-binding protein [Clostridia bacterium]